MSILTDGITTNDLQQILTDFGRIVSYKVNTKSTDAISGSEISTFGSASSQTVIFFLQDNKFIWDKEGLISVGDAYIIAPTTLAIKRFDQLTVDSTTYYIENVIRRTILQTAMCDYGVLFKVS